MRPSPILFVLALSACGADKDTADKSAERDPAITGALSDPIMTDPDLTAQNGGGALSGGGPAVGAIPAVKRTPEFTAAAKAEAVKLAGGKLEPLPEPGAGKDRAPYESLVQAAAALSGTCAAKLEYTALWATKLPPALEVYPRGAVQEAAGTDQGGCRLRVVNFQTPVSVEDVLGYYYTRLRASQYTVEYRLEGDDHVLIGRKHASSYAIFVRKLANRLTEVDLVANGG